MTSRPALHRTLAVAGDFQRRRDLLPPVPAHGQLPERALQFGTGALLRGLVEDILDDANRRGEFGGRVVMIGSTGSGRDQAVNDQDGLFTLAVRGIADGALVDERRVIGSVSRALSAVDEWEEVLACARAPELQVIFSNTTEVGIVLDEGDAASSRPPRSFPGKLARVLHERARAFGFAPDRGVVVVPCELIERNGDRLREIVLALAARWELEPAFARWVETACVFCNTLVDRIVPGAPSGDDAAALTEALGYRDALLTACEPYRLLAIEGEDALRARLGFADVPGVIVAPSVAPYRERKVRLLNGAHTILVPAALLAGCETVRGAMEHEAIGPFVRRAVLDEILPGVHAEGAEAFAQAVLDRFANPYIRHQLIDITLQGTMKMRVRVVPSIVAHGERTGRAPHALAFGFAAYLEWMRGERQAHRRQAGLPVPADDQGVAVREAWARLAPSSDLLVLVHAVCADVALWGTDLTAVPGWVRAVTDHLTRIRAVGVTAALEALLTAGAERG